jgi:Flp pilus assembly protein TadD
MKNGTSRPGPRTLFGRLLAGSTLALVLAGCQTSSTHGTSPSYTGSIGTSGSIISSDLTQDEALAAVQHWGTAYGRDPKDKVAALNFAAALKAAGQTKQAVEVTRKALIYHPSDREVLAAFGKALAADGQFRDALAAIQRAQRPDNPDWQLLATEGGILDSIGDHDKARLDYQQALVLAPGEPQILNNLGLSYVMTNELDKAEDALRRAAASPKATLKTRENLALVLRLRGKNAEAAQLYPATPATPATAPAAPVGNTAAAKPAAPQQNTWKELSTSG